MAEEIRVDSCYAITVKYLPATNTQGARVKLIPNPDLIHGLGFETKTLPRDYEAIDGLRQGLNYVVKVMGMPLPKYNLSTTEVDVLIFDKTEVNKIFYKYEQEIVSNYFSN